MGVVLSDAIVVVKIALKRLTEKISDEKTVLDFSLHDQLHDLSFAQMKQFSAFLFLAH